MLGVSFPVSEKEKVWCFGVFDGHGKGLIQNFICHRITNIQQVVNLHPRKQPIQYPITFAKVYFLLNSPYLIFDCF
jgi:hypothetical protein